MVREKKIKSPSPPLSPNVGDQRRYLYVALDHTADPVGSAGNVGLAVDVTLKGDGTTYTSNHDVSGWTILRNGPAATTVKLPAGTTPGDIASISVRRVVVTEPDDASLTVTHLSRAFFLGSNYRPRPSFAHWRGSVTLTVGSPMAVVWSG
jgi:hypothetical protein